MGPLMFWLSLTLLLVVFWCHSTKGNVSWPSGKYGLPMPKAGCPNNWFDGRRFHDDTDSNLIDRKVYDSLHLAGWVSKEGIEQDFCIKTSKDKSQDWPQGRYCILKHEDCPTGLAAGSVHWRPKSSHFQDKSVNGKQLKETTVNYCCSARGEISNAISLPLNKPFYLYTLSGEKCQQVKGATLKEEAVTFDKNTGRYQINLEGENPFQVDKNGAQMKLTYCYYTPGLHVQEHKLNPKATDGGTIGIPESQEVEKTLFTGSELDNKTQSSGLAVAIGIGIACAMVGTASIALVTKKLMRKKNEDGDDDDDDDDEPRPDDP